MRKLTAAAVALGLVGGAGVAAQPAGATTQPQVSATQALLCIQLSMPPRLCRLT